MIAYLYQTPVAHVPFVTPEHTPGYVQFWIRRFKICSKIDFDFEEWVPSVLQRDKIECAH